MKNLVTFQAVVVNEKGAFKQYNGCTLEGKSQFSLISLMVSENGLQRWADFSLKNILFIDVDKLIAKNVGNQQFIDLVNQWKKVHGF